MDWVNRVENICEKMKGQMYNSQVDDLQKLFELVEKYDYNCSGTMSMEIFERFLKDQ